MEEDDGSLNITPTFNRKSRSSKGKGKARAPAATALSFDDDDDQDTTSTNKIKNSSSLASTPAGSGHEDGEGDDDDDEGRAASTSVVRKSTASRKKIGAGVGSGGSSSSSSSRGLGASTQSKSQLATPSKAGPASAATGAGSSVHGRSKLSMSVGVGELEDNDQKDDESEGGRSASTRKLKRPPALSSASTAAQTPGTPANYDAAARLSSSLSRTTLSTAAAAASPSYSRDYLEELKASNLSGPRPSSASLHGSLVAQSSSLPYDSLTLSKYGSDVLEQDDDGSTDLPTQNAIAAAKARRETARRLGLDSMAGGSSSDYISLDVGMPVKNRESRLVREEDEIGEGEDEHADYTGAAERILLGKKGRRKMEKCRKEGMRELIDLAMEEEEGDSLLLGGAEQAGDDESTRWELEQIRRGEHHYGSARNDGRLGEKRPYQPAPIPEVVPIPTLLSTSNRLSSALSDLKRQKVESDALVEKSGQERSALDSQEAELKAEIGRVSSKYEWFLDFRSWIEDVAAFLEEKFPRLEKIEADNVSVQRERLSMLNLRRYKDDSDDVALFTGVAAPTKPPAASSSSSTGQGKNGSQQDMDIDQDEVDEMGRSRSEMDLEPRSYSRKIRREERQKRLLLSSRQQEGASDSSSPEGNGDGDLSDSELLTSDSQDLQAAGESLEAATKQLFADVAASEYIEPTVGIEPRFVEWRRQYREDFNDAFGGLAMVGVWEFWARCELATWNPFCVKELGQSPNSLEHFKWHRALTHFQHERAASLELSSGGAEQVDPGDDVVAGMATTVVIPRLRKLVAEGFDTYSSKANSTALGLVEEISYCVEPTSPRFESLVLAFISCFQSAILRAQSLVVPLTREIAAPRAALDTEAISARHRFTLRLLRLLSNGMRWRRHAKNVSIPITGTGPGSGMAWETCLARELVEKVMLPLIEAGWETGGSSIAARVLKLFPGFTMPDDVAARLRG